MYYAELVIDSCYAKATITGSSNLGGLIGYISRNNYSSLPITKCHTDCEITCDGSYAAGILGGLSGYGYEFSIRYCYAKVKIQANAYAAGILASSESDNYTLDQCYSTGEIACYNAGGLVTVEYDYGSYYITDCFSTLYLPLSVGNYYGYGNTNYSYRTEGYSPDLGWSSGPETWENSRVWETPIASFPKLLNVGGQED